MDREVEAEQNEWKSQLSCELNFSFLPWYDQRWLRQTEKLNDLGKAYLWLPVFSKVTSNANVLLIQRVLSSSLLLERFVGSASSIRVPMLQWWIFVRLTTREVAFCMTFGVIWWRGICRYDYDCLIKPIGHMQHNIDLKETFRLKRHNELNNSSEFVLWHNVFHTVVP